MAPCDIRNPHANEPMYALKRKREECVANHLKRGIAKHLTSK